MQRSGQTGRRAEGIVEGRWQGERTGQGAEGRGQRAEGRGQDRGQDREYRVGQNAKGRGQKAEGREQGAEQAKTEGGGRSITRRWSSLD